MCGWNPGLSYTKARGSAVGQIDRSENDATEIAQNRRQIRVEARGSRTVDDAMVVRQRHRQREARHELLAVPHRLLIAARQTEDRDFGRVDDRREVRPAD